MSESGTPREGFRENSGLVPETKASSRQHHAGMGIERSTWLRRLLVAQPAIAWPCVFVLWLGGTVVGLALAAVLLWTSALACVFGIIAPARAEESAMLARRWR